MLKDLERLLKDLERLKEELRPNILPKFSYKAPSAPIFWHSSLAHFRFFNRKWAHFDKSHSSSFWSVTHLKLIPDINFFCFIKKCPSTGYK